MATFKDLGDEMKKTAQNVSDNADRLVRRCALAIDATVVLATPVDTGRARGNWQVEIGSPASGVTDSLDPSGAGAVREGKGVIESYKGDKNGIYITNNLPYIERLNQGWSKQAPAGFVEEAIQVGVSAIQQEADKILTTVSEK